MWWKVKVGEVGDEVCASAVKFVAQGHVYDDVADPFQREIFDPEIGLFQSAAVVLACDPF